MKNFHWVTNSQGGNIVAKDIKEACKKAICAQIPKKLDSIDKKVLYFDKMKVAAGKLPEFWYC